MAAPSQLVGQTIGHYRLLEQVGAGGMGVVYRAHDEHLDREVALKVLPMGVLDDPGARARFKKEALALARINHPNIATVHEFGTHEDLDYLVTEFIAGSTLQAKLLASKLSEAQVIHIGLQLAHGLEAAHERGVIHRDLKPANLRFTEAGTLKILDFGVAKVSGAVSATAATEPAAQGSVSGTVPYMAPEQLRGESGDFRVDIWSAGAVLYEMATGRPPFPEKNLAQLVQAVLHHIPLSPKSLNAHLSPALDNVIMKCLEKNPARRYQSAHELSIDLLRLLPTSDQTAVLDMWRARAAAPVPSKRWLKWGALILVIAVAIGYPVYRRSRPQPNSHRVLAVLPFHALSGDTSTQALGAGMAETLAAQLSQAEDTSALQLVSIQEIADQGVKSAEDAHRQFGADLVLLGSLQQAGQMIRINCALVDPQSHRQVAAKTITGDANDIFALEDRAVDGVLDILAAQMRLPERKNVKQPSPATSAAYEHYVRGRGYLQEYQKSENIDSALAEFGLSIKSDPKYALAYAGRGQAYLAGYEQMNRGNDWVTKAAEDCGQSIALSPNTADGHICQGEVARVTGQYKAAVEQFQQALNLESQNEKALGDLATAYENLGDNAAAINTYEKAIAAQPKYWAGYSWLGAFYYRHAQYAEAVKMFQHVLALAPDNFRGLSNLGAVYAAQGRYSDALEQLKRSTGIRPTSDGFSNLGTTYFALRRFPEAANAYERALKLDASDWLLWGNFGDALYWTPSRRKESERAYRKAIDLAEKKLQVNPNQAAVLAFMATYFAMTGNRNEATATIHRALAAGPNDPEVQFRAALTYLHVGENDLCLDWLGKAVDAGYPVSALQDTPDFDSLRANPKFQALLKRSKASQ